VKSSINGLTEVFSPRFAVHLQTPGIFNRREKINNGIFCIVTSNFIKLRTTNQVFRGTIIKYYKNILKINDEQIEKRIEKYNYNR